MQDTGKKSASSGRTRETAGRMKDPELKSACGMQEGAVGKRDATPMFPYEALAQNEPLHQGTEYAQDGNRTRTTKAPHTCLIPTTLRLRCGGCAWKRRGGSAASFLQNIYISRTRRERARLFGVSLVDFRQTSENVCSASLSLHGWDTKSRTRTLLWTVKPS